ncbi:MAG: sigma-54 dependent transcriptional regulator [bacterium]
MKREKILIIDNYNEAGEDLKRLLASEEYRVTLVNTSQQALVCFKDNNYDLIFLDNKIDDKKGIEFLTQLLSINPTTVIIMTSENGDIQDAVKAVRYGAYNWVNKPFNKENVISLVHNALERKSLVSKKDILSQEIKDQYQMVGASDSIKYICSLIHRMSDQDTTILITGESGTGKEIVAHAVHLNSKRAAKHFIRVNCAAVPDSLLESELFGHKKGAFTGAYSDNKGKFQLADGGTLFFDEIGDLSTNAQAKILRTIETGEVEMIGNGDVEKVDVRLIFATNKNLEKLVAQGNFREDLLHRIKVMEIYIPPLRERLDDILPLTRYYLEMFCSRKGILLKRLTPCSEAVLLSYTWPGNVRELRNVIEKITILIDSQIIKGHHVADILKFPYSINDVNRTKDFKKAKKNFEKIYLSQALWENDWNISRTALDLKLPRSSIYEKIKEFGICKSPEKQTNQCY